jgi:TonB family protein
LAQAESALLEERLNDAAAAIDAARSGGVEGGRIAFLTAQLAKMREQQKRGAAARAKLDSRAADAGSPDERLQRLLGLAEQRIKEGRLIDPNADSAKSYVQEAMRIDPSANATQAAKETLAKVLMADTHAAVERGDFARAAALLDAAEGIAAPSNVENARQQLNTARQQGEAAATDQLLKTVQERIQQDRLIEPANDSAKYYLLKLRDADSGHAGLAAALQDLGSRMVVKARRAIDLKQYEVARDWLNEAAGIGFSNGDSQSASAELNAQRHLVNVVDASSLSAVKTVKPDYPARATLNRTEGWVELEFTVSENGEVKDITVSAANPPGVFDHAAIGALARWRYQPVIVDDKPVPQRARIRLRFTLAG